MKSILICDLRIEDDLFSHNTRDNVRFVKYFSSHGFLCKEFYRNRFNPTYLKSKNLKKIYDLIIGVPLKKNSIRNLMSESEFIFFPSLNFEDFTYLYWILKSLKTKNRINGILLRFISVDAERFLENSFGRFIVRYMFRKITKIGLPLYFAIETKEAVAYVESRIGLKFEWLPVPINESSVWTHVEPLTLFLPGMPRTDKGSAQIDSFEKILRDQNSKIKIIAHKVEVGKRSGNTVGNVGPALSQNDYKQALDATTWLFAPHILESFRIRGSALLTDSLENRIPILSRSETSLGNFVDQYKIGLTFKDFSDFFLTISKLESDLDLVYDSYFDNAINEINIGVSVSLERFLKVSP